MPSGAGDISFPGDRVRDGLLERLQHLNALMFGHLSGFMRTCLFKKDKKRFLSVVIPPCLFVSREHVEILQGKDNR